MYVLDASQQQWRLLRVEACSELIPLSQKISYHYEPSMKETSSESDVIVVSLCQAYPMGSLIVFRREV